MRKHWLLFISVCITTLCYADNALYQWKAHLAYGTTTQIERMGQSVYALADGALYSIDLADEELFTWSKLTGLNSSSISIMGYNEETNSLLLVYQNGMMDILTPQSIYPITDLYLHEMTSSKVPNSIYSRGHYMYLAMPFGIVSVDMRKHEISDTYYIGQEGSNVNVLSITMIADSIYAVGDNSIFTADIHTNLNDFNNWQRTDGIHFQQILFAGDKMWLRKDTMVYVGLNGSYERVYPELSCRRILQDHNTIYLTDTNGDAYQVQSNGLQRVQANYWVEDIYQDGNTYWIASGGNGVIRYNKQSGIQQFLPNGPLSNNAFRMQMINGILYVFQGSRWVDHDGRAGMVMMYDGHSWYGISSYAIESASGHEPQDFMDLAVDPFNPDHFFVTSYATGLYEFQGMQLIKHYHHYNSPLISLIPDKPQSEYFYIRTDGAIYDENGYLWFINNRESNYLHIIPPDSLTKYRNKDYANWYTTTPLQNGNPIIIDTGGELFIDKQNSHYKWLISSRNPAGLLLFDDNGTPLNSRDDRAYIRSSFTDQDLKAIRPSAVYTAVQDKNNDIWVGYDDGIFVLRNTTNFFQSESVERIKIPRNDGTNLADYLLNGERVNAIAVDGANRKWIGTASSGLFLMSQDGIETIEHFTTNNSPLLSDEIISIAIYPNTGEVFIGTSAGIMSFQSDATDPSSSFDNVYASPNPVRQDYGGEIAIHGLMDETVVYIVDEGGNLVCKTRSNGGTAIWDGKNANGNRVPAGIYNVLCNTADGSNHTVTKILIMR